MDLFSEMERMKWLKEVNEFFDQLEKSSDQIRKLDVELNMYDAILKRRVVASRVVGIKRCSVADDGLCLAIEDSGKIAKLREEAKEELSVLLFEVLRYFPWNVTPSPRVRGYGVYLNRGSAWIFGFILIAFGLVFFRKQIDDLITLSYMKKDEPDTFKYAT